MLDLPAVRVVATAVAVDQPRERAVCDAYRQIRDAWTAGRS
ncbi:hypothetical protein ABIA33_004953 [Streptacidiphilus sp. MAP12-16]